MRKFVMALAACALICSGAACGMAEVIELDCEPNGFEGGYVLCESLTVRESASPGAPSAATLSYGEMFAIVQDDGEWMQILYRLKDAEGMMYLQGWVRSAYVIANPAWFTPTAETPVYAMPSADAPRVGLIDSGKYAVIGEMDGYAVISLRGASGFVKQ